MCLGTIVYSFFSSYYFVYFRIPYVVTQIRLIYDFEFHRYTCQFRILTDNGMKQRVYDPVSNNRIERAWFMQKLRLYATLLANLCLVRFSLTNESNLLV